MINVSNPGNLLPFYPDKRWQRHRQRGQDWLPFALIAPRERLLPFQVFTSVASIGTLTFKLVSAADDTTEITLTVFDLEGAPLADMSGTFITWKAADDVSTIPDCGYWYIKIDVDDLTYYSEVLHLKDLADVPQWVLKFSNESDDKGNVMYQTGYAQKLYLTDFVLASPETDREVQKDVDGYGNITLKSSRTTTRWRADIPDLPDYVLGFLSKAGDLASVVFEDTDPITEDEIWLQNVEFEFRAQGPFLHTGTISFDAEVEAFAGCGVNFLLES